MTSLRTKWGCNVHEIEKSHSASFAAYFKSQINKMLKSKIDIIITSGAVSKGKSDYVPSVVKQFKA